MRIYQQATLVALTLLIFHVEVMAQQTVQVKKFSELGFARTLQFPARVVNLQLSTIAAETSGRILRFPAQVGDSLKKGQTVVQLNCEIAKINLSRLQAGLKRLKAQRQLTVQQLERAKSLSSSRSISRDELDQRQTQLDADDASIEEQQSLLDGSKQEIDYCQLKAPYSGIIIEKLAHTGAFATPGSPLFKLLKQDAVEIELEIPHNQLDALSKTKDLNFVIGQQQYPVKLRKIIPWINPATHQQQIRLSLKGDSSPPGGSRGLIKFKTPRHFIAASLIQKRNGKFGIFVYRNQQAIFKTLEQAQEGQSVAVALDNNELIITSSLKLLSDQLSVTLEPK